MHFVYAPQYDLNLGDHVFPSQKFRLIHDRLLAEGIGEPEDFLVPEPASDEDLQLAHDPGWIERLKAGTLSYREIMQLEIPWSEEMARAFILAAGGTTLAAKRALKERICYNIGGGFHHAFRAHGEGFCAINDIAVAIKVAQRDGLIHRAMVIDCDVHHGNGTASIFAKDPAVFTISIQQFNNYPAEKPPSALDIHLRDGTADEEYLQKLSDGIRFPITDYRPELVVYVAGADPYQEDQLGGLRLTLTGLKRRDELVMGEALRNGAAVAVVLAGGYARRVEDTVTIHCNTAKAAKELAG
jgi:acetoin utilization deacetylase AcuC-like enzyme